MVEGYPWFLKFSKNWREFLNNKASYILFENKSRVNGYFGSKIDKISRKSQGLFILPKYLQHEVVIKYFVYFMKWIFFVWKAQKSLITVL